MEAQLNFDLNLPADKVHTNLGRELTIRLTITDPKKAEQWLWNHSNNPDLGVHITGSSNGDMFKTHDILENALQDALNAYGDKKNEVIHDAFDKLEDIIAKGLLD